MSHSSFLQPLKTLLNKPAMKVIAVSSGKGGVGKSCIALNLAVSLAKKKKRVLLFDGNLTLPNLDVMTGLIAQSNLNHLMQHQCNIDEVIVKGPAGIGLILGSSDLNAMNSLGIKEYAGLIDSFNNLTETWDYLIIDAPSGMSEEVLHLTCSAHEVILVLQNEPPSVAATYALIKRMNQRCHWQRFNILTNMISEVEESKRLFNKIFCMTDEFLQVQLYHIGDIAWDESMHYSLRMQKPLVSAFPNSLAAKTLTQLAAVVEEWPVNLTVSDKTAFFIERV